MSEPSNVVHLRAAAIKNAGMHGPDDILEDQPAPVVSPPAVSTPFVLCNDSQMLDTALSLYGTEGVQNQVHVYDEITRMYKYTSDAEALIVNELGSTERVTSVPLPGADTRSEADYVLMFNEAAQTWGQYCSSIQPIPQLSKFYTRILRKEDWNRHVLNTEGSTKSAFLYSHRVPKDRHAAGVLPRVNVYVAARAMPAPDGSGASLLIDGLSGVDVAAADITNVSVDITARPDLYIVHHEDGAVEVQIISLCSDSPLEIKGTTPEVCITIRP